MTDFAIVYVGASLILLTQWLHSPHVRSKTAVDAVVVATAAALWPMFLLLAWLHARLCPRCPPRP